MTILTLGANCSLDKDTVKVCVRGADLDKVGMVWLPLDEHRHAKAPPAYLHTPKDWASVNDSDDGVVWSLVLPQIFGQGIHKLQLILYSYQGLFEAHELSKASLCIDDTIHYDSTICERHIKTHIVLDIYYHKNTYKCRALSECGGQPLQALGATFGVALDDKAPHDKAPHGKAPHDHATPSSPRPQAGDTWTGTAFAIDPYHLLTCHHVVFGANLMGIRQAGQADKKAYVVMSDEGSDTAIIRVDTPLSDTLTLATHTSDILGESVLTLGYPLSGLTGGLQATTGNIAGLLGLHQDIRFLQFTAPIQAGSSGSPVLLSTGKVVAMVTSSLTNAQNMNYAVKYQLLSALLMSAGIDEAGTPTTAQDTMSVLPMPQLVKRHKNAIWLVGCGA